MPRISIIKGEVIDVDLGTTAVKELHLDDGQLVDGFSDSADETIDARGCFVAPGFIDLHTHVFNHDLFTHSRLPADRIGVSQGVACVVDAGSSGAVTIDAFPRNVLDTQQTSVYGFVNIGSPGLPNLQGGHASRPELCDLAGTVAAFERHGDWLVGVKVLASQSHTGSFGLEAVKLARKAAELVDKPLMLHVGNAPPVIDDVLDLLRPGDIVTHTYHGKTGGVLGHGGRVIDAFREAVARGVIVDLGHGRSSFSFRVCQAALDQGMPLHTISSDLHRGNVERYAVSLARTMSKVRMLGFSLIEVVQKVTREPARAIAIEQAGFGRIEGAGPTSLTVFRELDTPVEVEDAEGQKLICETWIEPLGVLVSGCWFPVSEAL